MRVLGGKPQQTKWRPATKETSLRKIEKSQNGEIKEASSSKNNEQKKMRGKTARRRRRNMEAVCVCVCVVMMLQLLKLLHFK